ncbi:uncharacterized protein Osi24 [Eurosta solidaginis]|uniref:uncharacterized protein Osi24 n=1 Tax=Eurosta solidaginis TaxID=178769 RepID=UPI00353070E3
MWLCTMEQNYIRKAVTKGSCGTTYNQTTVMHKIKRKQRKVAVLKQEEQNLKMATSWLNAPYFTLRRTMSNEDLNKGQGKKRIEDKSYRTRWLSKIFNNKSPTTSSILRTYNNIDGWILLLLTVITVNIFHAGVMSHELTVRMKNDQITQTTTKERAKRSTHYSQLISSDGHWMNNVGGDDDSASFRPIIPKDISPELIAQNVFNSKGQYRVFQQPTSDLRETVTMEQKVVRMQMERNANDVMASETMQKTNKLKNATTQNEIRMSLYDKELAKFANRTNMHTLPEAIELKTTNTLNKSKAIPSIAATTQQSIVETEQTLKHPNVLKFKPLPTSVTLPTFLDTSQNIVKNDIRELEALLVEYAESFFNQAQYEPSQKLINALRKNYTNAVDGIPNESDSNKKRPTRHASANPHHHHYHHHLLHQHGFHNHQNMLPAAITRKADGDINMNIPRAMESGRLLFSSGLKKMLWPIFMGLQVLKSLLFALFLPTLIGSFGKLVGKGIITGSAPLFIRPADAPQDLDFRDNTINFDDDKFAVVDEGTKDDGYAYSQAEASQTHYAYNPAGGVGINRIEQQNKMPDTYLNALQTIGSASFKNSGSLSSSSSNGALGGGGLGAPLRTKPVAPANTNNFQTFQKVPASSLLLSNYDPFYSPLLSRLDSVFAQLKLNSDNENCREKLICLMYANPAKYAPYSNLVSAQLSRELNELRKPTSDNPDILRFFKYMRAAKDGQDGVDCEISFDRCKEFKDFENPAMVSTYHDINKLVQARKLT